MAGKGKGVGCGDRRPAGAKGPALAKDGPVRHCAETLQRQHC